MQFIKKVVLVILLIQLLSSFVLMYLNHYQYIRVLEMTIDEKEHATSHLVDNIFKQIAREYVVYAQELLADKEIIEAFAAGDRKKLLTLSMPIYKRLKKENPSINIMHFHTADTYSFLRVHKPGKFGDNLSSIRPIIVNTNKYKTIQTGLETGKFGISYRICLPVFKENKHIGAFEFGIDIKYLMSKLSMFNDISPVLLVSKDSVSPMYKYDKNVLQYLSSFNDKFSIVKYDNQADTLNSNHLLDEKIISEESYIKKIKDSEYLVFHGYELSDYNNSVVGHFIFIDNMDYYMDTIVFLRWVSITTTMFLLVLTVGLIYKLIKNYTFELREQKNILNYQAHHDALTGLPNRTLFNDRLEHAIQKANRRKSIFALLFVDLDRFKHINDSLGHFVGDKVLQVISQRLTDIVRIEDTVSRLGGDEFTILLEDLKDPSDASKLAKKIILSLRESIDIDEHSFYVTGSIGISIYPDDGIDSQNLLKYSDAAMYRAKEEGKNNFQYYSSDMTEHALEKVMMESNLRTALENEEFVVYYQPQINAKTGELVGMEALVRWQHPSMGLILPDKFIPLAEETGLIVQLDQIVMKIAMKQLIEWREAGLKPGVLALNLAIKQLQKKNFILVLSEIIKESRFKAEYLELEVSESQIMINPENAIKILQKISDMGIKLAIDDFGTGYSSLSYLKKFPIDKLKIDKSFVRDLPDEEEDVGISKAVIALAQSLKLSVIAEGVENKEQRDFLLENGCEEIQGYFYSKPIPASEMQKMLKSNRFI